MLQPTQKYMLSTYNAYQVLDELCQSGDDMGLYLEDDATPTYNFHTWFTVSHSSQLEGPWEGVMVLPSPQLPHLVHGEPHGVHCCQLQGGCVCGVRV